MDAHQTPDGLVVLIQDYNSIPGHTQMVVEKLSEKALDDAGVPYFQRIPIGGLDIPAQNNCRANATFAVVDSSKDDYVVAVGFNPQVGGNCNTLAPPVMYVARTGTAPDGGASAPWVQWDVPQIDGGTLTVQFARDSIAVDPVNHTIIVVADPVDGPSLGHGPMVWTSPDRVPEGGAVGTVLPIAPSLGLAGKVAYEYSPITHNVNAAFLGGDQALQTPAIFVGNQPTSTFPTTTIATPPYATNTLSGIGAVPVDKGRAHWHNFAGSENVLLIGRASPNLQPGLTGLNFLWYDNTGAIRSVQADFDAGPGGKQSALLAGHTLIGVDVTFSGTPTPGIAGLYFLTTENTGLDAGAGQTSYSLNYYQSTCLALKK
jgi:hypothetical protein